jgi:ketosteroid isomerase-like protein
MPSTTAETANAEVIARFFAAFAKRDWAGMIACYHPEVKFRDEVFSIKGKRAMAMWRMLCEGGKDLRVEASRISAQGDKVKAHWDAWYTFSATGRKVKNGIDAVFSVKDGLILSHRDEWSFWRWAAQALGPAGIFLGWMPRMQAIVQRKANANLDAFIAAHPEYREKAEA